MAERVRISERLILDHVSGPPSLLPAKLSQSHAIAYVASGDRPSDAAEARNYLDFFLLLYSYVTEKRVVMEQHIGTPLTDIGSLGARKVGLPHHQKVESNIKEPDPFWDEGVIKTKEMFLKFESDYRKIMDGYLGRALRFYYLAVAAAERWSRDEFIVQLTIAAEVLVQTGTGSATGNLKRRIATLVGNDADEIRQIAHNVGDLYALRGLVVHGHNPRIQLTQTKQLDGYVRKAFEKSLELRDMSKDEMAQMLDQKYATSTGETSNKRENPKPAS